MASNKQSMIMLLHNIATVLPELAFASIRMVTYRLISHALISSLKHVGVVSGKLNGLSTHRRINLTALSESTIITLKKATFSLTSVKVSAL